MKTYPVGTQQSIHNMFSETTKKNIYPDSLLSRTMYYNRIPVLINIYKKIKKKLFVLRFYGLVNPLGSCQEQSVYLTTLFPGHA